MKFCRRFFSLVGIIVGFVLFVMSILYLRGTFQTFFFDQGEMSEPMLYLEILTSMALISGSFLSLTSIPSSNIWLINFCLTLFDAGVLINELVKYTTKYDIERPEFKIDGYLITWLAVVFLAALLALILLVFALSAHAQTMRRAIRIGVVNQNRQMLGVRENLGVSVRSLSDQGSVMVEPAVRYPTVRSMREVRAASAPPPNRPRDSSGTREINGARDMHFVSQPDYTSFM